MFSGVGDSPGRSLTGKKKLFRYMVFSKTTACSSYVQPWLVAIGGWWLVEIAGWRLAVGGWRRLAAVGGSWQLVMGGWWRLAAVGGWWRLAVGGGWWLAVGGPLGRSLRAVLNKKKSGPLIIFFALYWNCCIFSATIVWCNPPPPEGDRSDNMGGGGLQAGGRVAMHQPLSQRSPDHAILHKWLSQASALHSISFAFLSNGGGVQGVEDTKGGGGRCGYNGKDWSLWVVWRCVGALERGREGGAWPAMHNRVHGCTMHSLNIAVWPTVGVAKAKYSRQEAQCPKHSRLSTIDPSCFSSLLSIAWI